MNDTMLEIKNLHAKVGEKEILKGVDLLIRKGEIHAVMGPNGAGKSTLSPFSPAALTMWLPRVLSLSLDATFWQ